MPEATRAPGRPPLGEGRNERIYVQVRPEVKRWIENKKEQTGYSESILVDALLARSLDLTINDVHRLVTQRRERNASRPPVSRG